MTQDQKDLQRFLRIWQLSSIVAVHKAVTKLSSTSSTNATTYPSSYT